MPHSISADEPALQSQENMADNGENSEDIQISQEADDISVNKQVAGLNDDEDITMADAGVQGEAIPKSTAKLEDLFADFESDEEFPSTDAKEEKASSSPEAPASPV